MEYHKLASVSGMSGLFEMLSSKSDGALVRSLEDGTTKFISSRIHNFSQLESIEVYTKKDNVNLAEVFLAMQKSTEPIPDVKADNKTLVVYFQKILPDIDIERVYSSDMKKMARWFNLITQKGIEIKLPENQEGDSSVPGGSGNEKKSVPKVYDQKPLAVKNAPAKKIVTPRKAS